MSQFKQSTIGRYCLTQLIGAGAYADVYLAHRLKEGPASGLLAIKKIPTSRLRRRELHNLQREVAIMRLAHHPRVVGLLDVIVVKNYHFLVMEYCAGGDVRKALRKRKKKLKRERQKAMLCEGGVRSPPADLQEPLFSETEVRRLLLQLVSGMRYMLAMNNFGPGRRRSGSRSGPGSGSGSGTSSPRTPPSSLDSPPIPLDRRLEEIVGTISSEKPKKWIHRDLKPENILFAHRDDSETEEHAEDWEMDDDDCSVTVTGGGEDAEDVPLLPPERSVRIADFGLAREIAKDELATTPCGSTAYAAPEVLCFRPYDEKADVYSIGVILFEMLYGRIPFQEARNVFQLRMLMHGSPTPFVGGDDADGDIVDEDGIIGDTPATPLPKEESSNVLFPSKFRVSAEAKHLISHMLRVNPLSRLSYEDILVHPFCVTDDDRLLRSRGFVLGDFMRSDGQIGEIFRGSRLRDGLMRPICIKRFEKARFRGEFSPVRFRDEVRIHEKLSNLQSDESILPMYDFIESERHFYVCFQYCSGGTLRDFVDKRKSRRAFSEGVARAIIEQLVAGFLVVDKMNNLEETEEDVKVAFRPDSCLVVEEKEEPPRVRLSGFRKLRAWVDDSLGFVATGIADALRPGLTQPEQISPSMLQDPNDAYASPQLTRWKKLLANSSPLSCHTNGPSLVSSLRESASSWPSNLYALGIFLLEMLTGKSSSSSHPLQSLPSTLSLDAVNVLNHLLDPKPANRPTLSDLANHPFLTRLVGVEETYRVIRRVGGGTWGDVFKAVRRSDGMDVAIRRIRKRSSVTSRRRGSLGGIVGTPLVGPERERVLPCPAELRHPAIADLVELIVDRPEFYFLVTEYIQGCNLLHHVRRSCELGRLGEEEVRVVACQICSAMKFLRENDALPPGGCLSPDDVMIMLNETDGDVSPLCIKLKRPFASVTKKALSLNKLHHSLLYFAPEVLSPDEFTSYDAREDLWAIGALLLELLAGTPPFVVDSFPELVQKIQSDENIFVDVRQRMKTSMVVWGEETQEFLSALLQRDPQQRISWDDLLEHPFVSEAKSVSI